MLLKKANTITTPTAYSNGFLHSVKPEIVENLFVQSNQFDTTWSSSVTLTSGQAGYDGSNDAWLLTKTASGAQSVYHYINEIGIMTMSVYAKAGSVNWMRLTQGGKTAYFNLSNGTIGASSNGIDQTITSVGNGWYRCTLTADKTTAGQTPIYPYTAEGDSSGSTDSIYIQDAQLNKGLTAYPYLETTTEAKPSADFTFTRNSSATRVNELGYIEDVQIIGGELVSNGDFEEIGSEEIVNGTFDTDSDRT